MRRLAAVALAALVVAGCSGDDAPAARPPADVDGLLERTGQTVAWTDDGLFVYGGRTAQDPATYLGGTGLVDPSTATVTPLPEPPFDAPLEPGGVAATSGGEVVLVGRTCARREEIDADTEVCRPGELVAAAYSLDAGSWRSIDLPDELVDQLSPDPEQGIELIGTTSDERVMIELSAGQPLAPGDSRTWTYAASDDRWEQVEAAEVTVEQSCLAGDRLVVLSSGLADESTVELQVSALGADGWTTSPTLTAMLWGLRLSCGSGEVFVFSPSYDQGTFRYAFDGPGSWEELPSPPDGVGFARLIPAGDRLVFANQDNPRVGTVLDPGASTWTRVDLGAWAWPTLPTWTGEELVVLDHEDDGISAVPLP